MQRVHIDHGVIGSLSALVAVAAPVIAPSEARGDDPASPEPAPSERGPTSPVLDAAPGPLSGRVLGVDGATPLEGVSIVLRAADGEQVAASRTDREGRFVLAEQPAGTYRLRVGRAQAEVTLEAGARARAVLLVLPEAVAKPLTPAQAEDTTTFLFWEMSTEAALGSYVALGAVVAGGTTGIVLAAQDDGGGGTGSATPAATPTAP